MKLARASRETFLYKQSGTIIQSVTAKTTPNRTEPIDVSHDGTNRISTLDSVSPTTTLYDIIAVYGIGKRNNICVCLDLNRREMCAEQNIVERDHSQEICLCIFVCGVW